MDLFVIRHARAVPREKHVGDDAARPLTTHGRERWRRAVRGLERIGVRFDRLLHSPWLRAVETAEALTPLVHGETVVSPWLARPPSATQLRHLEGERVTLVGHEPWLGELIGILMFGERATGGDAFLLKPGSVAWLVGEPRPGAFRLKALLMPKLLRRLRDQR